MVIFTKVLSLPDCSVLFGVKKNLRTYPDNKAFENDRAPFQLRLLMNSNKIDHFFFTIFLFAGQKSDQT